MWMYIQLESLINDVKILLISSFGEVIFDHYSDQKVVIETFSLLLRSLENIKALLLVLKC